MRVVIQRVSSASVSIADKNVGEIGTGLMILAGIETDDNQKDIDWLANKISNLRVFSDSDGLMNLSLKDIDGEILVISQFTLHAKTKKGSRPSYVKAARPEIAIPLYENFKLALTKAIGKEIKSGQFGANMQVALVNDGPVTIVIDSKD